jgi:hypothetical protein
MKIKKLPGVSGNYASLPEPRDYELEAISVTVAALNHLTWDARWRVLNYIIVRFLGRSWSIAKPASDSQ